MQPLVLGAVAYDAKVIPIWDGFKAYFDAHGLPFDFVLFQNFVELQRTMDDGRRLRLSRLGVDDERAGYLSSLHTRNFM